MALTNHGRNGLFSFLSSLHISVLRNLEANKLYDRANKLFRAALLTRCFVQHFLSPYIDSDVNHKQHFIKIPFVNKGIEFIDLHSIFNDNLVISSIPNYFNNSETPIICYKYNKPIRSTIFNFNKIVNVIDIDSNTPACEIVKILIIYIPLQGMLLQVILMSFLMLGFAILFLKVLNIDFPLILISLNVVDESQLL